MRFFSKKRYYFRRKGLIIIIAIISCTSMSTGPLSGVFFTPIADLESRDRFKSSMITGFSANYTDVSPEEVKLALETEDVFLLDVRTPEEYELGHIPGAYLIPVTELDGRKSELPANVSQSLIVYCRSGSRSATASEKLTSWGYLDVRNMLGGFISWKEKLFPVETGPFHVTTTAESSSSNNIQSTGISYWIFTGLVLLGLVIHG
ncbi:MAG: rhodanese-like domain-containing protein, partial [Candidatus Odinarchaeota archaeon]